MSNTSNTTVVNRHIVFLKDDAGWYASYWKNAGLSPFFIKGRETP